MFDEAISLVSTWTSMSNWFTPTFLFLFLNFMIATIFFTSSLQQAPPPPPPPPPQQQQQPEQQQQSPPSQITRAPSFLHRLKSINFYSHPSTPQIPSPPQPKPKPKPKPESKPRDRVPVWAASIDEEKVDDEGDGDGEGPTLEEIYSRIKGITSGHNRQKSDTVPFSGDIPVKLPAKIRKSASDKSAFNHFEAAEDELETENVTASVAAAEAAVTTSGEVNAMADDFISRFKKQLQLQRVESIMRYKDMITRGSAK